MRIEVITDILSVKIVNSDTEGMLDVLFNQGYLVPFKFDTKLWKFYVETVQKDALEEFKKNKEGKKTDDKEDLEELKNLPKELEEIKVFYKKDPMSWTIDLKDYVLDLLQYSNGD